MPHKIMIMFLLICSSCGHRNSYIQNKEDDSMKIIRLKNSFLDNSNASPLEIFISNYADSINNVNDSVLPLFLNDPQFDFTYQSFWPDMHTPISLRTMIFEKVKSCKALKLIIYDSSNAYKQRGIDKHHFYVKNLNLSFYDLAKNRYAQINCPE